MLWRVMVHAMRLSWCLTECILCGIPDVGPMMRMVDTECQIERSAIGRVRVVDLEVRVVRLHDATLQDAIGVSVTSDDSESGQG